MELAGILVMLSSECFEMDLNLVQSCVLQPVKSFVLSLALTGLNQAFMFIAYPKVHVRML